MDKDFDLVGITIYQKEGGMITDCSCIGANPTTAGKFARGCFLANISEGKNYVNIGDSTTVSWSNLVDANTYIPIIGAAIENVGIVETIPVTAAQIIAMYTTPIELVAAVDGSLIVVDDIVLRITRTATAFTGGGAVEFRYTDGSGAKVTADMAATVITGSAGTVYTVNKSIVTSLTGVVSSPIVMTNATQVFAAGTGTGVVTIKYHLV
jgi:hypothetical protein